MYPLVDDLTEPDPYPLTPELVQENFSAPPPGVGGPNKLTLMTVDEVVGGLDQDDLRTMAINHGAHEFAVAGLIYWRRILPPEVQEWLGAHPIHHIPFKWWNTPAFTTWIDSLRATASAGDDPVGEQVYVFLRKLKNLSGRSLDEADWEGEKAKMLDPRPRHFLPQAGGTKSHGAWLLAVFDAIDEVTDEIVTAMSTNTKLRTMEEWWNERQLWMPAGSSSLRHRLDEVKKACSEIASADRPNKKTVVQTIPYEDLAAHICTMPYMEARASTKHEPGFKQRALYAQDDMSTFVASFASADVEKGMAIGGMVAKQAPKDVVKWMLAGTIGGQLAESEVWCSLDYSDFNKEHANIVMSYLNISFARAWLRQKHSLLICAQRALCSLWIAAAHLNAWVRYPGEPPLRTWHGLWSGHRNTSRDNTILHKAYSMVVERSCYSLLHVPIHYSYMGICGDDEDTLHASWESMAVYLAMHMEIGHALNPKKQQIGYHYHEFLQRQSLPLAPVSRPLATTVATIATGNWYKEAGRFFDSAIASHSDYGWELITRGAQPQPVLRLVTKYLDRYMVAHTAEGDTPLEWWTYRNAGQYHPLWNGGRPPEPNPELAMPDLTVDYPRLAAVEGSVNDLITQRWHWLRHLTPEALSGWKAQQSRDANKAFFGRYGERMRHEIAAATWPARQPRPSWEEMEIPVLPNIPFLDLLLCINPDAGERRAPNLESALTAIGLDRRAFVELGGWEGVIQLGRPEDIRVYQHEIPYDEHLLPPWHHATDPALGSWLKTRNISA
ncbi:RNA-dependent RNA polymerase [Phytophthora condilina RNA virus 2]|nr:RNA-dependent RNA polymerase [Phytophthora condilina RNA virus 2]